MLESKQKTLSDEPEKKLTITKINVDKATADNKKPELVQTGKTNKQKNKTNKISELGGSRGVESLFRNTCRSQLDMITLAATKANIMISLNGFLVSVLLVSGSYFLEANPLLIIPFSTFLLTCTIAVVFAVLAARPQVDKTLWSIDDFRADRADLLVFEQFAKLSKEDYVDAMLEMVRHNDRVYRNMAVLIHNLGHSANHSFARLYISYSAFMIGLVISVILLFMILSKTAMIDV